MAWERRPRGVAHRALTRGGSNRPETGVPAADASRFGAALVAVTARVDCPEGGALGCSRD